MVRSEKSSPDSNQCPARPRFGALLVCAESFAPRARPRDTHIGAIMNATSARALHLALTAAVVLGFPLAATAQSRQPGIFGGAGGRPVRVLVGGGLTLPTGGEFKETHQNGFHLDAGLIFRVPRLPIA